MNRGTQMTSDGSRHWEDVYTVIRGPASSTLARGHPNWLMNFSGAAFSMSRFLMFRLRPLRPSVLASKTEHLPSRPLWLTFSPGSQHGSTTCGMTGRCSTSSLQSRTDIGTSLLRRAPCAQAGISSWVRSLPKGRAAAPVYRGAVLCHCARELVRRRLHARSCRTRRTPNAGRRDPSVQLGRSAPALISAVGLSGGWWWRRLRGALRGRFLTSVVVTTGEGFVADRAPSLIGVYPPGYTKEAA